VPWVVTGHELGVYALGLLRELELAATDLGEVVAGGAAFLTAIDRRSRALLDRPRLI
jgi:hypothetical protein